MMNFQHSVVVFPKNVIRLVLEELSFEKTELDPRRKEQVFVQERRLALPSGVKFAKKVKRNELSQLSSARVSLSKTKAYNHAFATTTESLSRSGCGSWWYQKSSFSSCTQMREGGQRQRKYKLPATMGGEEVMVCCCLMWAQFSMHRHSPTIPSRTSLSETQTPCIKFCEHFNRTLHLKQISQFLRSSVRFQ